MGIGDADLKVGSRGGRTEGRNVARRIDDRTPHPRPEQLCERPLGRPALDVAGGIDSSGQGPRIEPSIGERTRRLAGGQHLPDLRGRGVGVKLATSDAAHRAVALPCAEDRIRFVERLNRSGQVRCYLLALGRHLAEEVDSDDRSHHLLFDMQHPMARAGLDGLAGVH